MYDPVVNYNLFGKWLKHQLFNWLCKSASKSVIMCGYGDCWLPFTYLLATTLTDSQACTCEWRTEIEDYVDWERIQQRWVQLSMWRYVNWCGGRYCLSRPCSYGSHGLSCQLGLLVCVFHVSSSFYHAFSCVYRITKTLLCLYMWK